MTSPTETLAGTILATVHPSWRTLLDDAGADLPAAAERTAARITAGERVLPAPENIFRALARPAEETRVLILGQDPYPTPGHAVGLSFSSAATTRPLPKSLQNIYTEYESDLGLPRPVSADLTPWTDHGVMLLNRVLTVRAGAAGSDRGTGWEEITGAVVARLATRPLAAVLWGRQAQTVAGLVGPERCVTSAHPSPLSAYRGFFGSRPFSRVNEILVSQGAAPVEWSLAGQEVAP
ncbi:uracil-DNA glycosylase [uncultured Corynebacterium sp.]|uniref:uracil-DNA glycosylase n=1 Tax=uncultured Corynebacterium sp. TaxID=159447 RepID=UPI0025F87EA4|nr:uracil-DNA glycosylase [uncultured Corynebacterium sp.]